MSHSKLLAVCVVFSLLAGAPFVADSFADTEESESIYGNGVHAFFDRDYEEAVNILSKVEELKTEDPRPYYFLGLAYLRQKKTEQADKYFKKAAQLEFGGRALRDYAVSESLRRIQGEERLRLEKIRAEERINARLREQRLQEARYGQKNATAREELLQSTAQNQNGDAPTLQPTEDGFGNNAFGVKPIDPTNTSEENVIARKTGANPFGGVTISDEPEVVAVPTERTSEPVVTRTERTFVNTGVPPAQQETTVTLPTGPSPVQQGMGDAARQFGKALGGLFSKKANAE